MVTTGSLLVLAAYLSKSLAKRDSAGKSLSSTVHSNRLSYKWEAVDTECELGVRCDKLLTQHAPFFLYWSQCKKGRAESAFHDSCRTSSGLDGGGEGVGGHSGLEDGGEDTQLTSQVGGSEHCRE